MAGASGKDEAVPQLVETEYPRGRIGPLEAVDHGPHTVYEAAAEDPGHPSRWYRPEDGRGGDHGEPAHRQVEAHREPARGVHPENLEHDATQSKRPYEAEQPGAPAALEREDADGGVGPRNEDEDRHVVQLPQPGDGGGRDGQEVVEGARTVQRDEAATEDAKSHKLVNPASPR